MKRLFSVCVAVLFVIGAVASVQAADNLVLATGGTAGTYYPFGGAMAKIWNSKIKDMNVTAQTSGASAENVRLINKKEVELALVQTDTLDFAWNAKEAFKEAAQRHERDRNHSIRKSSRSWCGRQPDQVFRGPEGQEGGCGRTGQRHRSSTTGSCWTSTA